MKSWEEFGDKITTKKACTHTRNFVITRIDQFDEYVTQEGLIVDKILRIYRTKGKRLQGYRNMQQVETTECAFADDSGQR